MYVIMKTGPFNEDNQTETTQEILDSSFALSANSLRPHFGENRVGIKTIRRLVPVWLDAPVK